MPDRRAVIGRACGRAPVPSKAIVPADERMLADDGAQQRWSCRRRCGPSTQVILPVSASMRDAAQRLRGAVVEVDVLDGQHGRPPISHSRLDPTPPALDGEDCSHPTHISRDASLTAPDSFDDLRIAETWSSEPSASTEPSCRQVTLTPRSRTKPMSCSTTTTERVLAISLQQPRGLLGLGVGHAGDRLVDQQQLRVLGQQHADLQPLLLAVAKVGGEVAAPVGQADGLEDLLDARLSRRRPAVEQRRERRRASPVQRQSRLSSDRVALEHGRLLELAADAELGDVRLVVLGQVDRRPRRTPRPRPAASCR